MCYPYIVFGSVCGFQVTIERERNSLGFGEWGWIEGIVFLLVRHITHIKFVCAFLLLVGGGGVLLVVLVSL